MRVVPSGPEVAKQSGLGAEVFLEGEDINNLDDEASAILRDALHDHGVIVIRKAEGLEPSTLPKLVKMWDPAALPFHGHGKTAIKDKNSVLHKNMAQRIPSAPQVQILGNGMVGDYLGFENLQLHHVDHRDFHHSVLSEAERAEGQTRFYRWHIDAALYEYYPSKVTLIYSILNPQLPEQYVRLDTGDVKLKPGATAFFSGAKAFSLLSPEEKRWALNSRVVYAPRPYVWIKNCRARSNGLGLVSEGKELDMAELPEWTSDKVITLPLVYGSAKYRERGNLIALAACAQKIITTDPETGAETVMDDLVAVRDKLHSLQSRMMRPEYIYIHNYDEKDLVIFDNSAVMHSIVGNLEQHPRIIWQCNSASLAPPAAADAAAVLGTASLSA